MRSRKGNRRGRDGVGGPNGEAARVVAFPNSSAPADFLVDRLRNDNPALASRSVAEWADPLDAAILAALLLRRPGYELEIRECAARTAGRDAEAAFWRAAGQLLVTITSEGCSDGRR